ncbi:thioredoxin [Spirochaetia bacterium]|nr:thioredoxin [Spirochaetia bacterium]
MSSGISINSDNFNDEVLQSPVPVVVDFWAPWCGPCKAVGPILDELAAKYSGKLKICTINVDEENALAGQHNVVSIPTLVIYQNGKIVRQQVGALPKNQIEALFKDFI